MSKKVPRRRLYREVGNSKSADTELDEESKQYYEALAKRITSRFERFTSEELDMIEAFGFATGRPQDEH